jgi:hypothetical protein
MGEKSSVEDLKASCRAEAKDHGLKGAPFQQAVLDCVGAQQPAELSRLRLARPPPSTERFAGEDLEAWASVARRRERSKNARNQRARARGSRRTDAAMGARTDSALSARAIRGAEVDKLARARSPSAAPTPATRAALIGRTR